MVAAYLRIGKKPSEACRLAGYPESIVRSSAKRIAESDAVQKLIAQQNSQLIEQGRGIAVEDLGSMAKARIHEGLTKLKVNAKEGKLVLGYSRTAMESAGLIGGPAELHLHSHQQNFPPAVCKMMAEEMARILIREHGKTPEQAVEMAQGESSLVLDVEVVRPKAVEQLPAPPEPIMDTEPMQPKPVDTSAFEKEQMERFRADYARKNSRFIGQARA